MEASKLFVPGMWECPQCGFTQMNNVLSPAGVFASTAPELRPCPNDGRDMQPVTWEDYAKEILKTCGQMIDEREKDRLAIEELNQRLIERRESHGLQVVRIEETWRERLRAQQSQAWVLREQLSSFVAQYGCSCGHPACRDCWRTKDAKEVLSTPAPQVVQLEELQQLLKAIRQYAEFHGGCDHHPDDCPHEAEECKIVMALYTALKTLSNKYPEP